MSSVQNICFFNTTRFWGGGEKWHVEAATRMSETPHKIFFVSNNSSEIKNKLSQTKKIRQFHINVSNLSFLNPFKINQLASFFKKNKIDAVIFNGPKDLKVGGIAAKKAGVKKIVYRRGIAVEVKKSRMNEKLFGDVITHFIFNSEATKRLLEKNYKEILAKKEWTVIYNGIDFSSNMGCGKKEKELIVIGNAGRLVEQKGQQYLIDIAELLKIRGRSFKIQIAGEGPLREKLTAEIEQRGLADSIQLLGFVEDMDQFMSGIDIFVSTALWEGFGFVLAEAMAKKKPVLAFNTSSNPELIQDGKNGFLIPENDVNTFSEKLELLIDQKELREEMGKSAYEFALSHFEKEKQFQKVVSFLGA